MENVNVNNEEVKKRIFAAADRLYETCGRETFPTVDAVRREAKAAMGDVSNAMKEWRKAQTAQAVVQEVQAPDVILQAAKVLAVETWKQAQDLATESLKSAQAAWDAERAESESMRAEMSKAFDDQAEELDFVKTEKDSLDRELEIAHVEREDLCIKIDSLTKDIQSAQAKVDDQSNHIRALEAQIKDMRVQADQAAKKMDAVMVEKTDAEKKVAVLEATLFAEKEKIISLEKSYTAERKQTEIALAAYQDSQSQDRKALAAAEDRIHSLEDQAIRDRGKLDDIHSELDASQKEVLRLSALVKSQSTSSESSSGSEWA